MTGILIGWLASIVSLFVVAYIVPGFQVTSVVSAAIAAVVIGLLNATLGNILKLLGCPLMVLTLGIAALVVNALMLMLASALVDGFHINGFLPAFFGSILLTIVSSVVGAIFRSAAK
jgi:putative membrane protein